MNPPDSVAFKRTLSAVFALYGKDLSDLVLSVWWESMRPYDFAAVKDALNRHAVNPDSGQFLPKPADVVKLIDGGTQDSALQAWAKVDSAVRRVGPHQSVVFDDPLIHRVVQDMGGWIELGNKTDEEWPFVRNHFVNLYRGFRGRNLSIDYPRRLIGIAEMHNAAHGLEFDPPLLIGDVRLASRVQQVGQNLSAIPITQSRPIGELLPDKT